ncbi:MAG: ABC transporter permease [Bacilli bacterium]|nr:ABC transporter permease [Bacilli bacterium]
MLKYIFKRIGLMLMTFSIIFVMSFVLIKMLPFEPTPQLGKDMDIVINQFKERGYYDPIPKQLFLYLKRIVLNGDFGICYNSPENYNKPVWDVFVTKLPPTILINIYSSLFSVPIGIALGIFAALKKNKWQDHVISTTVMVFISVPSFVYASLVLYLFCFKVPIFPYKTILSLSAAGGTYLSWRMFVSMIPAVLAMSFGSIAGYARGTRAELTEVLTSEFMLLARTKGLTKSQATVRHALRNAMVPIFPSIIGEFVGVLSGSLVIEKIFGIPGVGGLYLESINTMDYDLFMMLSSFYILVGLAAGLVVDLSYGIIDPRIRMGAR